MALESTLLREVGSLSRCLHSFMDVRFRQYHLQRGQFIFLTRICEHPGIGQAALTAMCCIDKGTTSKAVRKLRESQYITCEADETDGRAVKLYPTSAGKSLYDDIIEEENRQNALCLRGFSEEEQRQILLLLQRMNDNVIREWQDMKGVTRRHAD